MGGTQTNTFATEYGPMKMQTYCKDENDDSEPLYINTMWFTNKKFTVDEKTQRFFDMHCRGFNAQGKYFDPQFLDKFQ